MQPWSARCTIRHLPGRSAAEIDRVLHEARTAPGWGQGSHKAGLEDLPDGAFVARGAAAFLKWQGRLWRWSGQGYAEAGPAGSGPVTVLTPAPTIATLCAGFAPMAPLGLA